MWYAFSLLEHGHLRVATKVLHNVGVLQVSSTKSDLDGSGLFIGTLGAGRRRGDFCDSSRVPAHAQSRSEIESPRARVPYVAECRSLMWPEGNFPLRQEYPSLRSSRIANATAPLTAHYGSQPATPPTTTILQHRVHNLTATIATPQAHFTSLHSARTHRGPVADSEIDPVPNPNLAIASFDIG